MNALMDSISTAVWIGRIFFKKDVRQYGSGNAGATNTIRVLGWKTGIIVLLLDALKGWIAVKIPEVIDVGITSQLYMDIYKISLGIAAVIGHIFPLYTGFKGGKGVATLLGIGIALYPQSVIFVLLLFFIILFITKYVSLASIISSVLFPIIEIFILSNNTSIPLMVLAVLVAIFIPITHRKNIIRLIQGRENKFTLKSN